MPEVVSFTCCDSTQNATTPNGAIMQVLVTPMAILHPMFVPGVLSFGLVIGICGIDAQKHKVYSVKMISPSGKTIAEIPNVPILPDDTNVKELPIEGRGFVFTTDLRNAVFDENGDYFVISSVDGEEIGRNKVPVYARG